MKCLVEFKHYSEGLSPYVSKKVGSLNVSRHLFRLISGLESMIIGEFQIVDQVKEAFYFAQKNKMLGPILDRMFQKSIETGKFVRTNTLIGKGAISVSYAAVEIISKKYELKNSKILCVGAGETSKLSVNHLLNKDIKNIFVTNRNKKRGEKFAKHFDLKLVPFENLKNNLKEIDVAIFCTSSDSPLISKSDLLQIMESRKNKNLLIVDLSVPRNIEENMSKVDGLKIINVDGLKDVVNKNYNKRKSEINKAQLLIDDYLKDFDEWASSRQLRPSILSIKSKIKNLIEKNYKIELNANSSDKLENKTDDLDVQMNNIYSKLSDHLVRKIRVASKNGKDKNALKIIKKIFEDDQ
jgi:glutamyl-tRNA reductase